MNLNFVKIFRRGGGQGSGGGAVRYPASPFTQVSSVETPHGSSAVIVAWGEYVNEKHIVKPFVEPSESCADCLH